MREINKKMEKKWKRKNLDRRWLQSNLTRFKDKNESLIISDCNINLYSKIDNLSFKVHSYGIICLICD